MQFPILFADADFCCGMDTPEKAKNVSGWLPGRAQNRGAFHFSKFFQTITNKQNKTTHRHTHKTEQSKIAFVLR